ncbi:kinase-like domain-containing protein [Hyaloraphidium curvatum]|nr:kinase-like domain-containing protein [Hyaloraphidium curvatum]
MPPGERAEGVPPPVPPDGERLEGVHPADPAVAAAAAALLSKMPFLDSAAVFGALGGGITNRNVLVAHGPGRQLSVLRVPGKDTALLCISREAERAAATAAAGLGIAPAVRGHLANEGVLLTAFVPGARTLDPEAARDPAVLARLAAMLRKFHALPPLPSRFDAFEVPGLHLAAALSRGIPEPPLYAAASAIAARIRRAFDASPEPRVPCHNDLLPANVLVSPGRAWLIDWEYAGTNDKYFDLGNLSVNCGLGGAEEDLLLREYFGGRPTARRKARLRLMKVMSDFREAMWGTVQRAIGLKGVLDYEEYAEKHFSRMMENAADAGFGKLLEEAAGPEEGAVEGFVGAKADSEGGSED